MGSTCGEMGKDTFRYMIGLFHCIGEPNVRSGIRTAPFAVANTCLDGVRNEDATGTNMFVLINPCVLPVGCSMEFVCSSLIFDEC